jgi:hypothetical protein
MVMLVHASGRRAQSVIHGKIHRKLLCRKFWLHYRSLRLAFEVCLMLGVAALCSYFILHTQG